MDLSYEIADKSILITPARFLFNAGKTPKAWNRKMLADEHLKVVYYEQDSSQVFPNTDIKGGIVITYHDCKKYFGALEVFTAHEELNQILQKVVMKPDFESLSKIIYSSDSYRLTERMHKDVPTAKGRLSNGHEFDVTTNIFEKLPDVFINNNDRQVGDFVRIIGRENND